MNLNDLVVATDYTYTRQTCHLLIDGEPQGKTGIIETSDSEILNFVSEGELYKIVLESSEKDIIIDFLNRSFRALGSVANYKDKHDPKLCLLDIKLFCTYARMDEMNIYLSDRVIAALEKRKIIKRGEGKDSQFYSTFAESFMVKIGANSYFAFSDGLFSLPESEIPRTNSTLGDVSDVVTEQSVSQDAENFSASENNAAVQDSKSNDLPHSQYKSKDQIDSAKTLEPAPEKEQRSIVLYGKNCSLYIRAAGSGEKCRLIAEKVKFDKNNLPCMKLGNGTISFNLERSYISNTVKSMLQESPGYIHLWNEYAQMEGEFLLRRARAFGVQNYIGNPGLDDGKVTLFFEAEKEDIKQSLGMLHSGDMINLGVVPPYIDNPEMTWEEYQIAKKQSVSAQDKDKSDLNNGENPNPRKVSGVAKIISTSSNSITLEWESGASLPQNPISLSILGDEKQIKRRGDARLRIENGESANPQLGLIIDGRIAEDIDTMQKTGRISPLSDYVKSKVFPVYSPTDNQRAAIDIALNTPDIAIIQGPPGTGKTTVIKAILERLNETAKKKNYKPGSVLVTSLQHDAVYNVSKALSINGMPTLKFGSRRKSDDVTPEQWEKDATQWCSNLAQAIREKHPQINPSMQLENFKKDFKSYLSYPCDERVIQLLEHALKLPISTELADRAKEMLAEFKRTDSSTVDEIIPYIRRLRVTSIGFEDDGPDNALSLYTLLTESENFDTDDEENRRIISVLKKAAMSQEATKELRTEIRQARNILLSRCLPPPYYSEPVIREDVVELAKTIETSINDSTGKLDDVLREFVNDLEQNSEYAKTAVQSYSYVFAATAQQSMSKDVLKAKNGNDRNPPQYDTVIVDEAARVTPADLMIPLSQAKRRIILVGDHRQLPHIYDEDIFEELQNNGDIDNQNDIKVSMFQHLRNSALQLEKADGVKRTITLNNQYRTHPMLGQFISENFYPPEEAFNSPMPAEHFVQPICKKPLMWVDIPLSKGLEKKHGTSRCRDAEADYITQKLSEYLKRTDCSKLTFGVITFYSAQAQLLKKRLGDLANDPRVTIGSVDAFQGLEFDVVFLSVVRTSSKIIQPEDLQLLEKAAETSEDIDSIREKIGMKYFGFLVMKNRLCVALSRQKKLLIVVGDKGIFTNNNYSVLADHCVSGMKKLYQLAQEEGEVINV